MRSLPVSSPFDSVFKGMTLQDYMRGIRSRVASNGHHNQDLTLRDDSTPHFGIRKHPEGPRMQKSKTEESEPNKTKLPRVGSKLKNIRELEISPIVSTHQKAISLLLKDEGTRHQEHKYTKPILVRLQEISLKKKKSNLQETFIHKTTLQSNISLSNSIIRGLNIKDHDLGLEKDPFKASLMKNDHQKRKKYMAQASGSFHNHG
jgi:hypothetical protein